jgi:hypothetical protein
MGNRTFDDSAFGASTTNYGLYIGAAVLAVDAYDNDFSNVLQAATGPIFMGAGSSWSRRSNRSVTGATALSKDAVDMPHDFVNGVYVATITERTGGGKVTVASSLVASDLKLTGKNVIAPSSSNVLETYDEPTTTRYGNQDQRDTLGTQMTVFARRAATVSTTDGSVTDIWSVAIPADTILVARFTTTAWRTGGARGTGAAGNAKSFVRHVTFHMPGSGTPTVLGTDTIGTDLTDAGADLTAAGILVQASSAASNVIKWQVQGAASTNIRWVVVPELISVNTANGPIS